MGYVNVVYVVWPLAELVVAVSQQLEMAVALARRLLQPRRGRG
jgi:hypothetical protein